jgi:hypothetical protein
VIVSVTVHVRSQMVISIDLKCVRLMAELGRITAEIAQFAQVFTDMDVSARELSMTSISLS